ncbi:MAG: hypothetical protein GDA45_07285 [Chromatiales bacterium]|nr:hypothetical protein [Chromatiales bacterium]
MQRSLLFVCALNTCRSIIGHAVFDYIIEHTHIALQVASAGIWATDGLSCDAQAQAVATRRGYDLSIYSSNALASVSAEDYSNVYIFEQAHFEPVRHWLGGRRVPEYIMNYSKYFGNQQVLMQAHSDIAYTRMFDLIEDGCFGLYKQLCAEREQ